MTCSSYFAQKTHETKSISYLLYAAVFAWIATLFRVEGLIHSPICFIVFFGLTVFTANERGRRLRLKTAWGCLLRLMIAGTLFIASTPALAWLNRYSDWEFYFKGFNVLSLLENHHRILDHLRHVQETSTHSGVGLHVAETVRIFLPLFYLLGAILTLSATILPINWVPFWIAAQADSRNFYSRRTASMKFVCTIPDYFFGLTTVADDRPDGLKLLERAVIELLELADVSFDGIVVTKDSPHEAAKENLLSAGVSKDKIVFIH